MSAAPLKSVAPIALVPAREGAERPALERPAAERPAAKPAESGGLGLVRVLGPGANGLWRVQRGRAPSAEGSEAAGEELALLDASVDPALVRECAATGARVVVEGARGALTIVGALTVQRPVVIDRRGHVEVEAKRIAFKGDEQVLLRSAGAFVQLRVEDVEIYGKRVVSRARELCRVLGRMVKIN